MLTLTHDATCEASAFKRDTISIEQIPKYKALERKFSKSSNLVSKFYGCYTRQFAELWHKTFGVAAAGASSKIDFGAVDRPSNIVDVMERIEKSPTSLGNPNWKIFE